MFSIRNFLAILLEILALLSSIFKVLWFFFSKTKNSTLLLLKITKTTNWFAQSNRPNSQGQNIVTSGRRWHPCVKSRYSCNSRADEDLRRRTCSGHSLGMSSVFFSQMVASGALYYAYKLFMKSPNKFKYCKNKFR